MNITGINFHHFLPESDGKKNNQKILLILSKKKNEACGEPLLNIDTAADYREHASKQFRSPVLQMDAPSSVSIHSIYSYTQRMSHSWLDM
jgi:hypothetical protein